MHLQYSVSVTLAAVKLCQKDEFQWEVSVPLAGGWYQGIFKVPSNSNHSAML